MRGPIPPALATSSCLKTFCASWTRQRSCIYRRQDSYQPNISRILLTKCKSYGKVVNAGGRPRLASFRRAGLHFGVPPKNGGAKMQVENLRSPEQQASYL